MHKALARSNRVFEYLPDSTVILDEALPYLPDEVRHMSQHGHATVSRDKCSWLTDLPELSTQLNEMVACF